MNFIRKHRTLAGIGGLMAVVFALAIVWMAAQGGDELTPMERCEQGISQDPCPQDQPTPGEPAPGDLGSDPGPGIPEIEPGVRAALEELDFVELEGYVGPGGEWVHRFDHPEYGYEARFDNGELRDIAHGDEAATIGVFCTHPDDDIELIVAELPAALGAVQLDPPEGGSYDAENDVSCNVVNFE